MRKETPWAVRCTGLFEDQPSCGKQFLTSEEYNKQLSRSNARWHCPRCGAEAYWDDDHYEKFLETKS